MAEQPTVFIGSQGYPTLQAAIEAAQPEDSIFVVTTGPRGQGMPPNGEKVLAWGRHPHDVTLRWHIAMRGVSWLEPQKGEYWFSDAGTELAVESWQPLPRPPTKEQT